ncbi:hypothetical protein V8G54_036695, partial [Vigna mungo]
FFYFSHSIKQNHTSLTISHNCHGPQSLYILLYLTFSNQKSFTHFSKVHVAQFSTPHFFLFFSILYLTSWPTILHMLSCFSFFSLLNSLCLRPMHTHTKFHFVFLFPFSTPLHKRQPHPLFLLCN